MEVIRQKLLNLVNQDRSGGPKACNIHCRSGSRAWMGMGMSQERGQALNLLPSVTQKYFLTRRTN